MINNKPPREKMPSAHDIAEELLKEITHPGGLDRETLNDPNADTPVEPWHSSAPPEIRWIERRIGKTVIYAIKAVLISMLIFLGSAIGSMIWSWLAHTKC